MSNTSFKRALLRSTMIAGLALAAAPGWAQTAADADATQNTQAGDTQDDLGSTGGDVPQGVTPQEGAPAEEASTGEIVVTGTLIRNPNLTSSAPVTVVGEDELDLQQASVAEEILRELPGVVPSIGSAVNNGNGGASFVNLRGLGSNRNIVLIDGVRLTPSELQGRFDLNNIPVALIERVDVLTGGASTTYGADAVSGVVNFITRSDFAGIDINLANTITERGDGHRVRADVTLGANFEDGRGNVVFSVGYQQADPVFQGARTVSVSQVDSFTGGIGGSGTSFPSRFTGVNPTRGDNANGTRQVNQSFSAFNTTAAFTPFNFNPFNVFQTPLERYNIYGAGSYEVADGIEVYARGLFSKNTVSTIIAPSGAFNLPVTLPLNNPFLTPDLRNAFCAADTNPAVGVYTPRFDQATCNAAAQATGPSDPRYRTVTTGLFRRAVEAGPRISDFDTTIFDQRVGVRGDITDNLQFDVFGAYGESENTQTQQGYFLNSRVRQSIRATRDASGAIVCEDPANGCVPANFFGNISPEAIEFLTENSTSSVEVTQALARGVISGDFGMSSPFADEDSPIGFAVGTEFREQNARIQSDLLSQSGDLGGAGGAAPNVDGGFKVYEGFAELIAPLVTDRPFFEELTLEAGIRYSDYKVDAPGSPSFNTTTYKVGGRYGPGGGLSFRGFYARAVRAPNISELFSPVNTTLTNLADDPCASLNDAGQRIRQAPTGTLRDVCLAQGANGLNVGNIPQPVAGQANSTGGGNLQLGPEKSNSYTIGAVFQPDFIRNLAITVDYYNIKVRGAITNPTPADVINACFAGGNLSATNPACLAIRRNPLDGSLAGDPSTTPGLPITLSNLGRLKTDGIDLVISYRTDLGPVGLALSFAGNYTHDSKFQATPSGENRECAGLYSVNCASIQPKYQWSQRTTLSFGDTDLSLLWRHLDDVRYEFSDTAPAFSGPVAAFGGRQFNFNRIPDRDYFDLSARFEANDNFSFVFLVENLLDKDPPLVGNTIGSTAFNSGNTFPSTYDTLGRRYTASARVRF